MSLAGGANYVTSRKCTVSAKPGYRSGSQNVQREMNPVFRVPFVAPRALV
jgi:hypothetical protein